MNEKKPNFGQVLVIGFFWVLSGALGLIILALGREAVLVIGINSLNFNRWVVPFVNNAYYFTMGLVWLAMFLFAEAYFSKGFQKNTLVKRVSRYIGIEILILAFLQVILMIYRFLPSTTFGIALAAFEVLLGAGLLALPRLLKQRRSATTS
jgi:hypothetical protein